MARQSRHDQGDGRTSERPLFLSEVKCAGLFGVSRTTFRRWVAAGFLCPVHLPFGERRKLYHREEVEAFARSLVDASVRADDLDAGVS